jgi:phosphomevalonate kinase
MIFWSDEMRQKDGGIFCREAFARSSKPIVIVSDVRRKTDIQWFRQTCGDKIRTIRISASDGVRMRRGWQFQVGVDDIQSECDLDDFVDWDFRITNEEEDGDGVLLLQDILELLEPYHL